MHKFLEWIKAHPWGTAGIIFGVGLVYILYVNSGSSSSAATSTGISSQQAALDAASLQAQTQVQGANIAAGVANNQTAAGVTVAGLQATTQQNSDALSAQTSQVIAGLQASVQNTSTAAAVSENATNTSALEAIALAPYQVEEDQINSTANATLTSIEGAVSTLTNNQGILAAAFNRETTGLSGNVADIGNLGPPITISGGNTPTQNNSIINYNLQPVAVPA